MCDVMICVNNLYTAAYQNGMVMFDANVRFSNDT